MARKLEVQIIGDASSLKKALGEAEKKADGFGSTLGGLAKAGVLAGGAAGVGALFVTLKAGISEFTQSTKVAAQTAAVIKSTGGAANVTSKHVDALATSIMKYSGIDDEAIKSGENMLLTFKNIRNEAGKGNDIFDQSTKILTDMSVALGGDASKNAIRLGKALNDPVKGVTALTKVGVTFSDAQKKTIKALVDSGNAAGAQKLILQELNSEFGGSAKAAGDTLPGQINKLKETFNNMAGDLVAKAVPAVSDFVGFISDKGVPALGQFFGAVGDAAGPAISKLSDAFTNAGPGIMNIIGSIADVIKNNVTPIFQALGDIAGTAIQKIGDVLRDNGPQIHQVFENLGTVISNLGKVVMPILKVAFDTVLPTAIRILIPVLELVTGAIAKITTVSSTVIADTIKLFTDAPAKIKNAFIGGWDAVKGAFGTAFDFVKKYAIDPIDEAVGFFRAMPGRIADALEGAVKGAARRVKDAIVGIFDGLPGFVKKALGIASPSKVFEGIGESIIDGTVKGIRNKAGDLLSAGWDAFKSVMPQFAAPGPPPKNVQDWLGMIQQPTGTGGIASGPASAGGLVQQVVNALAWARSHGWHGSVTSGFRSHASQQYLWDNAAALGLVRGVTVARPGTSSHEFGQAVDVTDIQGFLRAMSSAPPGAKLLWRGPSDPVHFSVTGHAEGGVINQPLHLFGEAGPEAVIPLGKWMDGWQQVKQSTDQGWTQVKTSTAATTQAVKDHHAMVKEILGKILESVQPLNNSLRDIVNAIGTIPGASSSSSGSRGGGRSSGGTGSGGGWVQVPDDPNGGWVQVPTGDGGWVLVPPEGHFGGGGVKMAAGGIVTGPTMALIGESGPEAVIPLDQMGGVNVHVHVGTLAGSSVPELADTIRRELIRVGRRNGGSVGLG